MIDQDQANDIFLEDSEQQFDEALSERDFNTARLTLADLEEKGIVTYELRRRMNIAMAGSYKPMDSQTVDQNIYSQLD